MSITFDSKNRMMFMVTCRICEKKFPAIRRDYCYCSPECRAEGMRIIWRWRKKLQKIRLVREFNGGDT